MRQLDKELVSALQPSTLSRGPSISQGPNKKSSVSPSPRQTLALKPVAAFPVTWSHSRAPNYPTKGVDMLLAAGYSPGKGLGKNLQGMPVLLALAPVKNDRTGLGFFFFFFFFFQ